MKLVIFGAIALVSGLAAGTGTRVFTAPALPAGADSLIARADSTYKAKAAHTNTAHTTDHGHAAATSATASVAAHTATSDARLDPHSSPSAAPSASTAAPQTAVEAGAAVAAAGPSVIPGPAPERYKQVGNILLSMKPVEAARVIAYMNDTQVQGLLDAMGPRQAAQILSQLPPERAATLSKRLLISPPQEAR